LANPGDKPAPFSGCDPGGDSKSVKQELARTEGELLISQGASGRDLLFHDVCGELEAEHRLYLPLPSDPFRNESVSPAGRVMVSVTDFINSASASSAQQTFVPTRKMPDSLVNQTQPFRNPVENARISVES